MILPIWLTSRTDPDCYLGQWVSSRDRVSKLYHMCHMLLSFIILPKLWWVRCNIYKPRFFLIWFGANLLSLSTMIGGNTILLSLNQDFIIDSKPWVYTSMILSTKLLFTPKIYLIYCPPHRWPATFLHISHNTITVKLTRIMIFIVSHRFTARF